MSGGRLVIWTIYERPLDFPNGYVLRPWFNVGPGPVGGGASFFDDLEAARAAVPAGLFRLPRQDDDDPAVLESWL
jgi:hypothetical protein